MLSKSLKPEGTPVMARPPASRFSMSDMAETSTSRVERIFVVLPVRAISKTRCSAVSSASFTSPRNRRLSREYSRVAHGVPGAR